MNATLVIPALNEAETIRKVIGEVREHFNGAIIVVDNGSTDGTAEWAREAGAQTVWEPRPGYGRACNAGIGAASPETEAFVFMDADGSDRPADIPALLAAIAAGAALALAVRSGAAVEKGSIAPAARLGNWLSGTLIGAFWGRRLHDLSPLKAIRADALKGLNLRQQTYGWTVEMLAKAAQSHLEITEVEVGYRHRAGGESKVSGNLRASAKAGYRILRTLGTVALSGLHRPSAGSFAGAAIGAAVLIAFSAWLLTQGPSSPRALVAAWLLAWPVILTAIGTGTGIAALIGRARPTGAKS